MMKPLTRLSFMQQRRNIFEGQVAQAAKVVRQALGGRGAPGRMSAVIHNGMVQLVLRGLG